MIHNTDKEAAPLKPIYAMTTWERHKDPPKPKRNSAVYNRWRASLPAYCWTCDRFDSCYPAVNCSHNPNRE